VGHALALKRMTSARVVELEQAHGEKDVAVA
jgi:hypothetical protein